MYMITCKKCLKSFPTSMRIDGIKRSLKNRKYCIECSPFGTHNVRQLEKTTIRIKRICDRCNKISFHGRHCSSCHVTLWRIKLKQKAIDYKGGKCILCGYNKCAASLDFHHIIPNEKDFSISSGFTRSWEKIKAELEKCSLVCRNCHGEIHAGLIDI